MHCFSTDGTHALLASELSIDIVLQNDIILSHDPLFSAYGIVFFFIIELFLITLNNKEI